MLKTLNGYILLAAACLSLVLMPQAAQAAYKPLQCDGSGGVVAGTQLYYATHGGFDANGDPLPGEGKCKFDGYKHVFSSVICNFTLILNEILGKIYCGLQHALVDTLTVLFSLYIAVFGFQLLMGLAQLNAKEVMVRLLKIAFIWAFATESAFGISFMFNFFMVVINDTSSWVVDALRSSSASAAALFQPVPGGDFMPIYSFFDNLVYAAFAGPLAEGNNKILGFFMAMMYVCPPMQGLFTWWLWQTFLAVLRSVLSMLMCMAAIAFLISLSPIFLSLILFQSTSHFFENWLRYMISYSLQMMLVFAIIVLWIIVIIKFVGFFTMLSDMIFEYHPTLVPGPVYEPTDTWGICPPVYGKDSLGPTAECEAGFDPEDADIAAKLIPPSKIPKHAKFIYFVFYHLVTLMLITYAFSVLLDQSHNIARTLSGGGHSAQLLAGWGMTGFGTLTGKKGPAQNAPGPPQGKGKGLEIVRGAHELVQQR